MRIFNQFTSRCAIAFGLMLITAAGVFAQAANTADNCVQQGNRQAGCPVYSFTKLATLGDSALGGGFHINDFEPGAINNRGDVIYGTDLGTSADPASFFGEGVFLRHAGQISELARAFTHAPGGGVFDFLLLGQTVVNAEGDGAFAFTLSPFGQPVGVNSGVYRHLHSMGALTSVVVPGQTHAPAGGTFVGVGFNTSLNNLGDLLFTGIVKTDKGIHVPGEPYIGLGMGVFKADQQDRITSVVSPGDAAPASGFFDWAANGWVNQTGDIAFAAHVAGEEIEGAGTPPQAQLISALPSLYVKNARTGTISSIAHAGDAAPRGGKFRQAFAQVLNDSGDVVFLGDLTPPPNVNEILGVYLHSGNTTLAVARPGDAVPGGGTFVSAPPIQEQLHINNAGEVVFNGVLSTGIRDTGLFVWSRGSLRLVARTGSVIPGVGTVSQLAMGAIVIPPPPGFFPNSGATNNDRGQVLFGATLSDGGGVLLLATPND